jgi:HlyD family secretion protein
MQRNWARVRRRLGFALATAVIAAVMGWAFVPRPVPVDVAAVSRGPMIVTVDEDGRTRIKERYVVSAPLAGRLLRIELHPGDCVEAGKTVIAAIEPSDPSLLDARAREEAEARLGAARAALDQAGPNLERARTAHSFAASELRRIRKAFENRAATRAEFDAVEQRERTTHEEMRAAEFALRIAEFERNLAQAALSHGGDGGVTGGRLRFEISSPITGRVLRRFQESATVVSPGSQLVEVGDPADLEVEVDVLSRDAVRIKPGDRVLLEDWGGAAPLTARVRLVEPAAFTKVSSLGVEEQRAYVVADFVDPPEKRATLGDAYRVEARIVVWESDNVLKVPAGALFRHGDDWAVFVLARGRVEVRPVKLGQRNASEAEVITGLTAGDTVVQYPSDRIRAGVRVEAHRQEP